MRKDLNKVLCERERHRSELNYREVRRRKKPADLELLPLREPMKNSRMRKSGTKSFNEHLNPLYGFIRKSTGRPWDKVYSEICKTFDKNSVINQHILTHLFDHVEIHAVMHEGKVCVIDKYKREYVPIEKALVFRRRDNQYFVHPKTKILMKLPQKKKERYIGKFEQFRIDHVKQLSSMSWLIKDGNDIWYLYEARLIPPKIPTRCRNIDGVEYIGWNHPHYEDLALPFIEDKENILWDNRKNNRTKIYYNNAFHAEVIPGYNKSSMYMASKKQLSTKELKRYGLI